MSDGDAALADAIVAMRGADMRIEIPGSVERTCALCDVTVRIAPSTLRFFAGVTMPPIWCLPCAADVARRGGQA